jgi:hypothetical protein
MEEKLKKDKDTQKTFCFVDSNREPPDMIEKRLQKWLAQKRIDSITTVHTSGYRIIIIANGLGRLVDRMGK